MPSWSTTWHGRSKREYVDPLAALFGVTLDEMPWARDFEVTDLDGNRIRLAEALTGD